jgi:hypothetical protein
VDFLKQLFLAEFLFDAGPRRIGALGGHDLAVKDGELLAAFVLALVGDFAGLREASGHDFFLDGPPDEGVLQLFVGGRGVELFKDCQSFFGRHRSFLSGDLK